MHACVKFKKKRRRGSWLQHFTCLGRAQTFQTSAYVAVPDRNINISHISSASTCYSVELLLRAGVIHTSEVSDIHAFTHRI